MTNSSEPSNNPGLNSEGRLARVLHQLRLRFHERLSARLGLKPDLAWLESQVGGATDRDILEQIIERSRNHKVRGVGWISRWRYRFFGRP